jgi:hypothetical protein
VGVDVFLTLVLDGGEWSASRPGRFTPREKTAGTHWMRGWVDPRAGLHDVEKRKFLTLPGLELRRLGYPARSQSLYRLRYPDSYFCGVRTDFLIFIYLHFSLQNVRNSILLLQVAF